MTPVSRRARSEELDLWLVVEQDPESNRYNVPIALDFAARPDERALLAALRTVFERHPALRSTFRVDGSGSLHVDMHRLPESIARVRYSPIELDRGTREKWAAGVGLRPLNLQAGGTARADLLMLPDGAVLVITVHHIVMDGWSVDVLLEDLAACYDDEVSQARSTPAAVFPSTPIEVEPEAEDPSGGAVEISYWLDLLRGDLDPLEPLPDRVRTSVVSRPARQETAIESPDLAMLRTHARDACISVAAIGLAAWATVLHQWSDRRTGVLMTPFSARSNPATHREIGLLSRTLPVRSEFDPTCSWIEYVRSIHAQLMDSFEASAIDTGLLRERLVTEGRRFPAARAIYSFFPEAHPLRVAPGVPVTRIDVDLRSVKYDTSLAIIEGDNHLRMQLDYEATLYTAESAQAMLDQLRGLLCAASAEPDVQVGELVRRAGDGGAAAVIPVWQPDIDLSLTPAELVMEVARAHPSRIAVVDQDRELTYAELLATASRIAHWLIATAPEEPLIGTLLPGGVDAVVAILSIALSGKAYVPMDPAQPDARLLTTVEDAAVRRILTSDVLLERAVRLGCEMHPVEELMARAASLPSEPPAIDCSPDQLLNVLYTSGSTGRPKGVMLTHGGISRLVRSNGYLHLEGSDRVAQLCALNFDGATFEIWGALAQGARLVVLDRDLVLSPKELGQAIRRYGVTALIITAPVFNSLVDHAPEALSALSTISIGGDVVDVERVRRGLLWSGPGVLLHTYGPTENSFTSLLAPIDHVDDDARTLSLGRCVPGTRAYVVRDGTMELVPVGACGELLLGGDGLADGYLRNPRRTAERFVPDPFSARPGRLYRTGDRVRVHATGELQYLGRTDDQVKIRGQRIELGDVRAAVLRDPDVRDAYIALWRNDSEEKEIAAYVVLRPGGTTGAVRDRVSTALPSAAVPARWAAVDVLPLTPNDKVDVARLPMPTIPATVPDGTRASTAGGTARAVEVKLVRDAWGEVLERTPGDHVNFFDAGGHSLLLARLQAALTRRTGVEVKIADLFRFPSIRAQAEFFARTGPRESSSGSGCRVGEGRAPIAVIGAGARFAGASDVRQFWEKLALDCVSGAEVDPVDLGGERRRIGRWGLLDSPRAFDAELFGLTPEEARMTDPQHALLHECLWAAMEDAAVTLDRLRDRTSIYAGCAASVVPPTEDEALTAAFTSQSSFAATRYAYLHDLRGETVMVDTACSTSLVAVHLACASLRSGASDFAFAGGVSISDPVDGGYVYEPGLIYAEDGVCRPFDQSATGTIGGDGAGVVLLRRLSDAIRDGDPIHAVIRGSAVRNDGRARAGYAAPGFDGQVRVVREALADAGVTSDELGFVETHGTGTRLGDAIEASALAEAVGERVSPLPISSVKSAIGHCNTAAGIAGLLAAVHAVHDHALPGTVNSVTPIDEIATGGRLRLLTSTEEWRDEGRARIAGVSSFGIGGTNAHVIVEEFIPEQVTP